LAVRWPTMCMNLLLYPIVNHAIEEKSFDWFALPRAGTDAGLGNGASGAWPPAFSTHGDDAAPAMGYGLRYEYGIFKQTIRDGWQQERPDNWLDRRDPWEVARPTRRLRSN